jgi:hypothetical protein
MARGNRRETDRQRAENRSKKKAGGPKSDGDPLARKERWAAFELKIVVAFIFVLAG